MNDLTAGSEVAETDTPVPLKKISSETGAMALPVRGIVNDLTAGSKVGPAEKSVPLKRIGNACGIALVGLFQNVLVLPEWTAAPTAAATHIVPPTRPIRPTDVEVIWSVGK